MNTKTEIIITLEENNTEIKLIKNGETMKAKSIKGRNYAEDVTENRVHEAIRWLFKPTGYTGRAIYIADSFLQTNFTYGKIYDVVNGVCTDDLGNKRHIWGMTVCEDQQWLRTWFLPIQE